MDDQTAPDLHDLDPEIVEAIRAHFGDKGKLSVLAGTVTERERSESTHEFWIKDGDHRARCGLGVENVLVGQQAVIYCLDDVPVYVRNVDTGGELFAQVRPATAGLFWFALFAGFPFLGVFLIMEGVDWWWKLVGIPAGIAFIILLGSAGYGADTELGEVLDRRRLAARGLKRVSGMVVKA